VLALPFKRNVWTVPYLLQELKEGTAALTTEVH